MNNPVNNNEARIGKNSPETSRAAAKKALPRTGTKKEKIYNLIMEQGMFGLCDHEIEKATGWKHQSASAMRNSLMRDGWVIDSGSRRNTDEGNPAIVWIGCGINNLATEAMPNAKLRLD